MEEKRSYVYRHRRLDTKEVFCIGKGSTDLKFLKSNSDKKKYKRAYSKKSRNTWWKNIVTKYDYEIEIISKTLTEDEANELEEFLISLYKRKDCCGGSLVNLTDGGEGLLGYIMSDEQKQGISIRNSGENNKWFKIPSELHPMFGRKGKDCPFFGKKHNQDTIDIMRKPHLTVRGENNHKSKIVLHTLTGIFYNCIREAAEVFGIKYSTLKSNLNGTNKKNKTDFLLI